MNTVASLPAKLLLDDLDVIWNSVSDDKETNGAYQRIRSALASPAPSAGVGVECLALAPWSDFWQSQGRNDVSHDFGTFQLAEQWATACITAALSGVSAPVGDAGELPELLQWWWNRLPHLEPNAAKIVEELLRSIGQCRRLATPEQPGSGVSPQMHDASAISPMMQPGSAVQGEAPLSPNSGVWTSLEIILASGQLLKDKDPLMAADIIGHVQQIVDALEPLTTPPPAPVINTLKVRDAIHGTLDVSKVFPGDIVAEERDFNPPPAPAAEQGELSRARRGLIECWRSRAESAAAEGDRKSAFAYGVCADELSCYEPKATQPEARGVEGLRQGNWHHPDGGRIVGWVIEPDDVDRMKADAFCLPREVAEALTMLRDEHPVRAEQPEGKGAVGEVYALPTGEHRVELGKAYRDLPVGTKVYASAPAAPGAAVGVDEDAIERAVRAHDREDAGQKGEPDPWADEFPEPYRSERMTAMRLAFQAAALAGKAQEEPNV